MHPGAAEDCGDDKDNNCDGLLDCFDSDCDCSCPDDDEDGACNDVDVCPGQDDNLDTDNDGVPNCLDQCPEDPNKTEPGQCGCGNQETPGCGEDQNDNNTDNDTDADNDTNNNPDNDTDNNPDNNTDSPSVGGCAPIGMVLICSVLIGFYILCFLGQKYDRLGQ